MKENLNINSGLEIQIRQEAENVLSYVRAFKGEYGYKTQSEFVEEMSSSIRVQNRPHILTLIGEPRSGKSHLVRDILATMWNGSEEVGMEPLKTFEGRSGRRISVDLINWGDVISLSKLKGEIKAKKKFGELSNEDIEKATNQLERLLAGVILANTGYRRLIVVEVPAVTSAWIIDPTTRKEKLFGVNRGLTALWNLSGKKGRFKDLTYTPHWLGVVAHPFVKEQGIEVASKIEKDWQAPQKVAKILKKSGEVLNSQSDDDIREYAHESPNVLSIKVIAEQANRLAEAMSGSGLFSLDIERFKYDQEYRAEIMGEHVLRLILKDSLNVRKNVFIAYNQRKLDNISFDMSVPVNNPIWQQFPDIAKIVNK